MSGPHLRCWAVSGWQKKPGWGQDCFPRPHASLYPHTDYFAMECKEVCGFGKCLFAGPTVPPREQVWPSFSSGLCASRRLPHGQREGLRILSGLLSHSPFSPSNGSIARPKNSGTPTAVPASQTSLLLFAWPGEASSPKDFSQNWPLPPYPELLPLVILLLKGDVSVNQTELNFFIFICITFLYNHLCPWQFTHFKALSLQIEGQVL